MGDVTNYCYIGTPLPPLEKPDGVPAKRHQNPEDQIVTDENGRRRFHGAFTGGFSAGYWNTVGSQEGWTPQSFKSSRSEKAPQRQQQRPEDFMDAEDLGEFGIAPKKVQVRPEFAGESNVNEVESKERKRKLQQPNIGPIPGQPVLSQLLKSADVESVAVRILKHWGWKPGRGVGPRQTLKEKKQAQERNKREMYVLERYGCDVNTQARKPIGFDDSDEIMASSSSSNGEESEDDGITYAPEDFEPRPAIKENRYGLGYTPLSRDPVLAQDIVAQPTRTPQVFEVVDKNNMRFSITGQAFGVGALEDDDDEEVYHREDWTKYDFSLQDERQKGKEQKQQTTQDNTVLEGFVMAKKDSIYKPIVYKVTIPPDFRPRNWAERRSRFEPLDPHRQKNLRIEKEFKQFSLRQQTDITPEQRGQLLGEETKLPREVATTSAHAQQAMQRQNDEKAKALLERITKSSNFTKGGIITADGEEKSNIENDDVALTKEREILLQKAHNKTKGLATDVLSGSFKPFVNDEAKQKRYDEFLKTNLRTENEISDFLRNIQPVHLSEWDREMEKKEFIQARNIYKPLGGIMSDRFVSEAAVEAEKVQLETVKEVEKKIIMQRTTSMWKPSSLLCKRYNIAEPYGGALLEEKKPTKAKMSIFDYLETSVNKKSDFQTPVIIPKHIETPMAIVKQTPTRPLVTESTTPAEPLTTIANDTTLAIPSTAAIISEVATTSSERTAQTKGFVARTDLQKRVVESIDQPASEKIELFKAIFDDSDDEEEESSTNKDNGEEEKSAEAQPPPIRQPISAAAANLLRNNSPPRGLFAALFKADPIPTPPPSTIQSTITTPTPTPPINANKEEQPKIAFKPRNERLPKEPDDDTADVYGPKLPERSAQTNDIEGKILQLLQKHKEQAVVNQQTNDEWIERKLEKSTSDSADETSDSESDSRSNSSASSSDKHKRALKKKKSANKLKKHKSKDRHKKHVKKEKKHKSKKTTHKSKKAKKSSK